MNVSVIWWIFWEVSTITSDNIVMWYDCNRMDYWVSHCEIVVKHENYIVCYTGYKFYNELQCI